MRLTSATRRALALSASLATTLVGCTPDRAPTAPDASPPPKLGRAAFLLTIDVETGQITVGHPAASGARRATASGGPSLSLLGGDAIALQASPCTWSAAASPRQKRCRFALAIENRLVGVDLIAPTTFPQPPQGTSGILVFPYAAAALGVPGGGATPTTDWDNAPANFFNDFDGCAGGKASDCYRSETFPGPLYGGETTFSRAVGFDVDKDAHSVSVYVVVAADLRSNPLQTITLPPTSDRCGYLQTLSPSGIAVGAASEIRVGRGIGLEARGFCSFAMPLSGVRVEGATLRLHQQHVFDMPYEDGAIVVDHLDFGSTLADDDWDLVALTADVGPIASDASLGWKALDVTSVVRSDLANARAATQFRFRLAPSSAEGIVWFDGPSQQFAPELVVTYRNW